MPAFGHAVVSATLVLLSGAFAWVGAESLPGYGELFDGHVRPDDAVAMMSHSERLFPFNVAQRRGPVRRLRKASTHLGPVTFESVGKSYDLYDYLAVNRVAGLLILKDHEVVLEDYELGTNPGTRWCSFSMSKSVASTLLAVALERRLIGSLDEPVTRYVPALKGSAYDDVSIRNILQMSSGVEWDETYTNPESDQRKLAALRLQPKPGVIFDYVKTRPRAAPPGSRFNYNTSETVILGAIVEGATHAPLAKFLSDTIWSRLGMEQDATWWLESPGGMAFAGGGLGATLRDYGRFGLFVLEDGVIDGVSIVPHGWFREAGSPHVIGGKKVDYGYQWWTMSSPDPVHEGAFEALGAFGQHLYINPHDRVVIVVLSARPKPNRATRMLSDDDFFAAVMKALR